MHSEISVKTQKDISMKDMQSELFANKIQGGTMPRGKTTHNYSVVCSGSGYSPQPLARQNRGIDCQSGYKSDQWPDMKCGSSKQIVSCRMDSHNQLT